MLQHKNLIICAFIYILVDAIKFKQANLISKINVTSEIVWKREKEIHMHSQKIDQKVHEKHNKYTNTWLFIQQKIHINHCLE